MKKPHRQNRELGTVEKWKMLRGGMKVRTPGNQGCVGEVLPVKILMFNTLKTPGVKLNMFQVSGQIYGKVHFQSSRLLAGHFHDGIMVY